MEKAGGDPEGGKAVRFFKRRTSASVGILGSALNANSVSFLLSDGTLELHPRLPGRIVFVLGINTTDNGG